MAIESLGAAYAYRAARVDGASLLPASDGEDRAASFSAALGEAARAIEASLAESEKAAGAALAGETDVAKLVEALSATELALETAVTVRDRVVEAYQEILRMPV